MPTYWRLSILVDAAKFVRLRTLTYLTDVGNKNWKKQFMVQFYYFMSTMYSSLFEIKEKKIFFTHNPLTNVDKFILYITILTNYVV